MGGTATTPDLGQTTPPPAAQPPASMQPQAPNLGAPTPPDVTEQGPGVASRVYHGILSALGGANDVQLARDADGKMQASVTSSQPGTQWKRIIAGALTGMAGASQVGTGPGGKTRALGAGINSGMQLAQQQQQQKEQQANQDYDEQQKTLVRKAQLQQMAVQTAASSFSLERAQHEAADFDAKHLNDHMQWIRDNGGTDVGTFRNFAEVSAYAKNDPTLAADIAHGRVSVLPHLENGKVTGIDVARMPQDWGSSFNDKPLPIQRMVPGKDGGPPTWETETIPAGTIKNSDYNAAVLATTMQKTKMAADKVEEQYKQEQTRNLRSEEAEHYAQANKDNAGASQIRAGMTNPDGTPNPRFEALAQSLYDGDITTEDLKREAKGSGLDPNQVTARAVEIGKANGKPWSESIIKQEKKFAESTKTQAAIDGIDRIIGPKGYMSTMLQTAEDAHLGTNGAFNSASLGVQRFFGGEHAKNFNTAVSETRRSIAGLIGNPLLGGSETDKKLEQAEDMLGGSPTLENLRGATSLLKNALQTQRDSIVNNNRFLAKRYGSGAASAAPSANPQPPPIPAGTAAPAAGMKRVWAPGMATWRDVPANQVKQIPGQVVQ